MIMSDQTPLHAPNSLRTSDSAGSNKENVHSIDSDIESSQPTVLRPPLQAFSNRARTRAANSFPERLCEPSTGGDDYGGHINGLNLSPIRDASSHTSRSALGQYYGGGRADLGKIRGVGGEARPRCDRRQRGEVVVLVGDKGRRGEVVVGKRVGGARLWWG
uniref:Uncharacterized protein n=1 Tax=Aegilops tauschii subsp. strangulata TaxID=200361 RepID=A0A452ZWG0_AEGTS